jgi:hypothetical protein
MTQARQVAITGEVLDNPHGNRSGVVTIKSKEQQLELFYDIAAGFRLKKGDMVTAFYKPELGDFDGVLLSAYTAVDGAPRDDARDNKPLAENPRDTPTASQVPPVEAPSWINLSLVQEDGWKADIRATCLISNQPCGTISFRGLSCGGNLIFAGRAPGGYVFKEDLNYGSCRPGCKIFINDLGSAYRETCNGSVTGGGSLVTLR